MSEAAVADGTPPSPGAARRLADAATWRRLLSAGDLKSFSEAWLALLVAQIDLVLGPMLQQTQVVRQGMVALGAPESRRYARTAWFGADREISLLLAKAGERAIQVRHGTVQVGEGPGALCQIAHPILVGDTLHGVVSLELPSQAKDYLDIAMRLAQWGVAWFAHLLHAAPQPAVAPDDSTLRLAALAAALSGTRLDAAAETLATLLCERLDVDKVSLGLHRRDRTRLLSVSHGGFSAIRNDYLTALTAAMEETADADGQGGYPVPGTDLAMPHAAHARLCRSHGSAWARSVAAPVPADDAQFVVLAEGAGTIPDRLEERLAQAAADIAPVIAIRLLAQRNPFLRIAQQTRHLVQEHPRWRQAAFAAMPLLLIGLAALPVPYTLSVEATLETSQRRVLAAPFDGYLAEATARPGDRLSKGALLARFDDRDLQHQRTDIIEHISETDRALNEAIGLMDRAKAAVLAARKAQYQADLSLVDDQLRRSAIRAPFNAIVVAGDKTQSIGAPMHRGDPLYVVAPAGSFQVALDVPQDEFAAIAPGQHGSLVLTALPYRSFPIQVTRLTPIAIAHNNETVLRAEAALDGKNTLLRLGMQGVAHIDAGRTHLGWLLTHRIIGWIRMQLWAWLP